MAIPGPFGPGVEEILARRGGIERHEDAVLAAVLLLGKGAPALQVPVVRRLGFASDPEPSVGDRVPHLEHLHAAIPDAGCGWRGTVRG